MSEKPASNCSLLEVKDLAVLFHHHGHFIRAVDGASLTLKKGTITGLVGESGSGKTQLALSILGLNQGSPGIVAGRIELEGKNLLEGLSKVCQVEKSNGKLIIKKNMRKWRQIHGRRMQYYLGRRMSIILQEPVSSLDPFYSIGEQIMETVLTHRMAKNRQEAYEITLHWLRKVEFPEPEVIVNCYPYQLSGGMCQRAMIAIALCSRPGLLIADEPTTALDAPIQFEILQLLKRLNQESGITILLITHDLAIIKNFVDEVYVMYQGKIVDSGPPEKLFSDNISHFHQFTRRLLTAFSAS